mmetsp:Transcript_55532/g.166484  ORF Transcript_55532/g.166484 Transcript_55532/m.166484 type:complete len:261 (+) Transcript_55532:1296-2078(+)
MRYATARGASRTSMMHRRRFSIGKTSLSWILTRKKNHCRHHLHYHHLLCFHHHQCRLHLPQAVCPLMCRRDKPDIGTAAPRDNSQSPKVRVRVKTSLPREPHRPRGSSLPRRGRVWTGSRPGHRHLGSSHRSRRRRPECNPTLLRSSALQFGPCRQGDEFPRRYSRHYVFRPARCRCSLFSRGMSPRQQGRRRVGHLRGDTTILAPPIARKARETFGGKGVDRRRRASRSRKSESRLARALSVAVVFRACCHHERVALRV